MTNRRWVPVETISDNGINFVWANWELKESMKALYIVNQQIWSRMRQPWHFNPPLWPHFGGAHKSLIKAAKAVLSNANITNKEYVNLEDGVPSTANHFLHGQWGSNIVSSSINHKEYNRDKTKDLIGISGIDG